MIPFVREMAFEYGEAAQVSPLIRRVVARNPGPFTYLGTGTYIVGAGEVAVIDPGPDDPEHLDALRRALAGERVVAVLVTHDHADHSPLARPLAAETGARIYGRSRAHAGSLAENVAEMGDDGVVRHDVEIVDGQAIAGPGWTLEAIATPGHTSNHVCYALAEENAGFTGDHVMGWSTTVIIPPDGDMGAYFDSLAKIAARGFATLWPTHGPPVTEPAPFLTAYAAHRRAREAQVLDALAAGPQTIAGMVPRLYRGIDQRLFPAAAQSMLAHLILLVRQGRATTEGPPELASLYRLA